VCCSSFFSKRFQAATNSSVSAIAVTSFDSTTPLIESRRTRTRLPRNRTAAQSKVELAPAIVAAEPQMTPRAGRQDAAGIKRQISRVVFLLSSNKNRIWTLAGSRCDAVRSPFKTDSGGIGVTSSEKARWFTSSRKCARTATWMRCF